MKRLLLFLAALCVALPALAATTDVQPANPGAPSSCVRLTMCDAEVTTGICRTGTDTANIVAIQPTKYAWRFDSTTSVGTWSCTVVTNSVGVAATGFDYTVPGITLTETSSVAWFDGDMDHFWFTCSAISSSVTIIARGCPLK